MISETQLRPAGAEHLRHAERRVGIVRVALLELLRQLHLRRIDVGHGEPLDGSALPSVVLDHHVDGAPVGEAGHGELRHLLQRGAIVDQRRQGLARLGEEPQGRLRAPALALVAGDGGGADDLAVRPGDRGDRRRHLDAAAVLAHPHRLEVGDALAAPQAIEDLRHFVGPLGGDDHVDRAPDRLARGVAVEPLGAGVPARDHAVERGADDGVVGVLDDGGELGDLALPALLLALESSLAALQAIDQEAEHRAADPEAEQRRLEADGLEVDPAQDRIDGREHDAERGREQAGPEAAEPGGAEHDEEGQQEGGAIEGARMEHGPQQDREGGREQRQAVASQELGYRFAHDEKRRTPMAPH